MPGATDNEDVQLTREQIIAGLAELSNGELQAVIQAGVARVSRPPPVVRILSHKTLSGQPRPRRTLSRQRLPWPRCSSFTNRTQDKTEGKAGRPAAT